MSLQPQASDQSSSISVDQATITMNDEMMATTLPPASNNILNQNLSGSFSVDQPIRRDSYEEDYSNSQNTIYQPIGSDVQQQSQTPRWPVNRNCHYQPLSNSRLGVVAIPNQNFQPSAMPAENLDGSASNSRRPQRDHDPGDNTQRASRASSDKYFV